MRRSKLLLGTGLLLLISAVAVAQDRKVPFENKDLARLSLEIALKVKERLSAASRSDCDMETVKDGECIIEMSVISIEGHPHPYCLAQAPLVKVKRVPGLDKFVNWKLEPAVLTGDQGAQVVQFHPDAGIVTTYEKNGSQIDKKNRGHGKGDGPVEQHKFHVKTLKDAKAGESGYLPVVMWDRKGNGELELCAAIDPKIVNEN